MRVCVLYSGGKDSNLAFLKAYNSGLKIACLISLIPSSEESVLFHYPNMNMVKLQAQALGLPLICEECPNDEEGSIKALFEVLKRAKEEYSVEGVVTGAIRSIYQASRFQRVCWKLKLWCFNPLWLKDEISLLNEIINYEFEVIFTRVAGYPLKKSLLGRRITKEVVNYLSKIKNFVNPSGEGGEYETLVLDMPLFRKRIEIIKYEIIGEDYDATLLIKEAKLVEK